LRTQSTVLLTTQCQWCKMVFAGERCFKYHRFMFIIMGLWPYQKPFIWRLQTIFFSSVHFCSLLSQVFSWSFSLAPHTYIYFRSIIYIIYIYMYIFIYIYICIYFEYFIIIIKLLFLTLYFSQLMTFLTMIYNMDSFLKRFSYICITLVYILNYYSFYFNSELVSNMHFFIRCIKFSKMLIIILLHNGNI